MKPTHWNCGKFTNVRCQYPSKLGSMYEPEHNFHNQRCWELSGWPWASHYGWEVVCQFLLSANAEIRQSLETSAMRVTVRVVDCHLLSSWNELLLTSASLVSGTWSVFSLCLKKFWSNFGNEKLFLQLRKIPPEMLLILFQNSQQGQLICLHSTWQSSWMGCLVEL